MTTDTRNNLLNDSIYVNTFEMNDFRRNSSVSFVSGLPSAVHQERSTPLQNQILRCRMTELLSTGIYFHYDYIISNLIILSQWSKKTCLQQKFYRQSETLRYNSVSILIMASSNSNNIISLERKMCLVYQCDKKLFEYQNAEKHKI